MAVLRENCRRSPPFIGALKTGHDETLILSILSFGFCRSVAAMMNPVHQPSNLMEWPTWVQTTTLVQI